jgi:hypothetical protein
MCIIDMYTDERNHMYNYKKDAFETIGLPDWKGWTMEMSIVPFYSKPWDYDDWYDDVQVAAWREDKWWFAELAITASANGVQLGTASMTTVEYGQLPVKQEDGTYKTEDLDAEYYKREYVADVERLMIEAYDDAMERVRSILEHIEGKREVTA